MSLEGFGFLECIRTITWQNIWGELGIWIALAVSLSTTLVSLFGEIAGAPVTERVLGFFYQNSRTLLALPIAVLSMSIAVVGVSFGLFTEEFLLRLKERRAELSSLTPEYFKYYLYAQLIEILLLYMCIAFAGGTVAIGADWLHWTYRLAQLAWLFVLTFWTLYSYFLIFSLVRLLVSLLQTKMRGTRQD